MGSGEDTGSGPGVGGGAGGAEGARGRRQRPAAPAAAPFHHPVAPRPGCRGRPLWREVFKYSPAAHDAVEVTRDGYLSCSPSSPIAVLRTDQGTVELDRLGRRYFICGVPGHCDAGMKLQVRTLFDSPSPPGANGAPGVNGAPAGICVDGSSPPTIISTPGVFSYSSAPVSSGSVSTALAIMAAAVMLIVLMD
ncbi:hypothetical protein E2562_010171 [Oryza meyeriana var. granulata]|uniref:Phytocyanin domain-containing protein n=1 Tax=Oryza meyeriana var. granulata TaxID=110450 RepID=A0A6G1EIV6_9ORYZ|nr:hypothetical protein E2562_010171 [Oryza meyeriana var. granulata]